MANFGFTRLLMDGKNIPVIIKLGAEVLDDIITGIKNSIKKVADESTKRIIVTDITALTAEQLEALQAGDMVVKRDATGDHSYRVSYKGATGICLTYSDCENVETIAYEKVEGTWTYDSKDVTHIAS